MNPKSEYPSSKSASLMAGLGTRSRDALLPSLAELGIAISHVYDEDPHKVEDFAVLQHRGLLPMSAVFTTRLPPRPHEFTLALVATSHDSHHALTRYFTSAGCWVLKEKPLARNWTEADDLVRECGSRLGVLVERPHLEVFQHAARVLDQIGIPEQYTIRYWRTPKHYLDTWRNDATIAGGGAILDLGYHVLDLVSRLWGHPMKVEASITDPLRSRAGYTVEEDVKLALVHQSGCRGAIHVSRIAERHAETYEVFGSHGVLRFNKSTVDLHRNGEEPLRWTFPNNQSSHSTSALRGALSFVGRPEEAMAESRHALGVMDTIARAYDSIAG